MARQNNFALDEVNGMLAQEALSIFDRQRLKDYLKWAADFPVYSGRNQALIHHQMPDATMVAGYDAWKKQGRHVMKGQKGIKIYAAMRKKHVETKKDAFGNIVYGADGQPEKVTTWETTGWRVATVFDVSQTAGKPVPSLTTMLRGKVDGFSEVMKALSDVSPVPIEFWDRAEEIGYLGDRKQIALDYEWSEQKMLQVLLPSVAAAILSQEGTSVSYDSLEAESAAYVIASHLGIDADYDFDYITDWKADKSVSEFVEALARIRNAATQVIDGVTKVMANDRR